MEANKRLYYVDWLRVLAMLTIFLFHADRFFDFFGWHVKNSETNLFSTLHVAFFSIWIMPLFFVLSGAAIVFSLGKRSSGQFLAERFQRVLLPLLIAGYFVTSPPQSYLDRVTNHNFAGSFGEYLPLYFEGVDLFGGNFPWHGFHLWYLLYLFIFSVLLLPFFRINPQTKSSLLARFATCFESKWMLCLLPIPIIGAHAFVDLMGMDEARGTGGWSLFAYLFFLMYGYLVFSNRTILQTIVKTRFPMLMLSVVLSLIYLGIRFGIQPDVSSQKPVLYLILATMRVTCSLSWICCSIGLSEKYLNFTNGFLQYANQAVLPFYILHQLILLVVGCYIVQWQLATALKYLIIAAISFSTIMLTYELLIRRIRILRFLFGMQVSKPRQGFQ